MFARIANKITETFILTARPSNYELIIFSDEDVKAQDEYDAKFGVGSGNFFEAEGCTLEFFLDHANYSK